MLAASEPRRTRSLCQERSGEEAAQSRQRTVAVVIIIYFIMSRIDARCQRKSLPAALRAQADTLCIRGSTPPPFR